MATPDMDVIRDIPGYKVILKAIIKSQIQQLVEQLATHTDEESVILTASVSDGTLSHLGSDSGKGFLEEQEDVKSQFLGFCLKRHHKQKQAEKEKEKEKERLQALAALPGQMDMGPGPRRPIRMPYHGGPRQPFSPQGYVVRSPGGGLRHEPYHIPRNIRKLPSSLDSSTSAPSLGQISQTPQADGANFTIVKSEPMDDTNSDNVNKDDENTNSSNPNESAAEDKSGDDAEVDPEAVKVEAISETEFELEITGVEPGVPLHSQSMPQDNWGQNVSTAMGFDTSIGAMGSSADMSSQQGYSSDRNKFSSEKNVASQFPLLNLSGSTKFPPLNLSESSKFPPFNATNTMIEQDFVGNSFDPYTCPVCYKLCCSKWKLQTHMRTHTGEKPFKCQLCGRCFSVKGNLKSHMAVHSKPL